MVIKCSANTVMLRKLLELKSIKIIIIAANSLATRYNQLY